MDPWMLTHLRLARSRGSLQAPNSRVQDMALEVLDMVEQTKDEASRVDMVKGLLALAQQEEAVSSRFPEYFRKDPFAEAYNGDEFDIDKVDDSAVRWDIPDLDQDADISAWIEEQESKNGGVTTFTATEWM